MGAAYTSDSLGTRRSTTGSCLTCVALIMKLLWVADACGMVSAIFRRLTSRKWTDYKALRAIAWINMSLKATCSWSICLMSMSGRSLGRCTIASKTMMLNAIALM